MKKDLLFIAVGLFLFLSCKKEPTLHSKALESFVKLENPIDQRLAFNLLTSDERIALVSNHIDFCISFFNLTPTQRSVLIWSKERLPSFFTDSSPKEKTEILILEKKIDAYFSKMDLKTKELIFSTVVLSQGDVDKWNALPTIPSYSSNCSCSTASDYCTSGSYCFKGGCNTSNWGCGTFWAYGCGGLCFSRIN